MKRHWQCPKCASIYIKENIQMMVVENGGYIAGTNRCYKCMESYDAMDVYGGKLDMSAPDDLVSKAINDSQNTSFNYNDFTWYYMGSPLYGPASIIKPDREP
jgi:hypothetical protein